jgi:hypothetical protein
MTAAIKKATPGERDPSLTSIIPTPPGSPPLVGILSGRLNYIKNQQIFVKPFPFRFQILRRAKESD